MNVGYDFLIILASFYLVICHMMSFMSLAVYTCVISENISHRLLCIDAQYNFL